MRCALSMTTLVLLAIPLEAQDQPMRPPITGIAHVRIYCTDEFWSSVGKQTDALLAEHETGPRS